MSAEPPAIAGLVAGVLSCGYVVAGAFFLRFWARTREPLFAIFAGAFWLMALNQALPVLLDLSTEEQSGAYLLRATAYVMISVAIVFKNLRRDRGE